jgi:uncharacterized protein
MGKFDWQEEDMVGVSVTGGTAASTAELDAEIERVDALLRAAGFDPDMVTDAAPMTRYVNRPVVNAKEIIAWAKAQGFKTTLPADDLHVTIAYSHAEVDWMDMGEAWEETLEINAGGPRLLEQFGEASVLSFASSSLKWRHEQMREKGASWQHASYQPHITISYSGMPEGARPYTGRIILGPEKFEKLEADWMEGISEE